MELKIIYLVTFPTSPIMMERMEADKIADNGWTLVTTLRNSVVMS